MKSKPGYDIKETGFFQKTVNLQTIRGGEIMSEQATILIFGKST
ncbi:MAG: hypothetical protein ACLFS7_02900 [Desulfosudaceae bacterium]